MIIGICGRSCSGKTTIAKSLAEKLSATFLTLDSFYIEGLPKEFITVGSEQIRTRERPQFYDGDALAQVVTQLRSGQIVTQYRYNPEERGWQNYTWKPTQHIVLEGFLLFAYKSIRNMCSERYYIDISAQESIRRRFARTHGAQDSQSYAKVAEKEWTAFGEPQQDFCEILDGTKSPQVNVNYILTKIKK
jgi:uridine kinase